MTYGDDPLDSWGPGHPATGGPRQQDAAGQGPYGSPARPGGAEAGAGAGTGAGTGAGPGTPGGDRAGDAHVSTEALATRLAGMRRARALVLGSMVVGDLVIIVLGLTLFEAPVRWILVAFGVLGFAAAAYLWNLQGKPIREVEEKLALRGHRPAT